MKIRGIINRKTYKHPINICNLGEGWSTNTINTVIFRHHGIVTRGIFQFCAYYDPNGNVIVCKRNLKDNTLESYNIESSANTYDAHNSISIGIDSKDYIHISYDHHSSKLKYKRSLEPLNINKWTDDLKMTGENEGRVTYPSFLMLSNSKDDTESKGELLFLYRDGNSGCGDAFLNKYEIDTNTWVKQCKCLLNGSESRPWTSNAYWNHPSSDGERLFLSYVWRVRNGGPNEYVNNCNIGFACSKDLGKSWSTSKEKEIKLPITQVNYEVIKGIPLADNLINQTSQALDSRGNLHIVYYSNDNNGIPQYQHLWFDGVEWKNKVISNRKNNFNLMGAGALKLPISRPEIVIDKKDNIYVIFRADFTGDKMSVFKIKPPYNRNSKMKILWDENLCNSEPVIDRIRWKRDGILSMLIQKNYQPDHDLIDDIRKPEPCYIVDWKL